MPFNWSDDLEYALSRISELATGGTSLRVYRAGGRVALAIPDDPHVAEMVLHLYQPQRLKGRVFKQMVSVLCQTKSRFASYSHEGTKIQLPEIEWLRDASTAGTLGFLGCNPVHGLRCIVTGVSPSTGESFIVKLGCGESVEAVMQEHAVLSNLQGRYPGVISTTGMASGKDWFAMKLPYLGHTSPSRINQPAVVNLLNSWCSEEKRRIDEWGVMGGMISNLMVKPELNGWQHKVGAMKISRALVHGDFAVWNLRHTNQGLYAIDWEWADENGIAGIDLIHGLRQEAVMVRKLKTKSALTWMRIQLQSDPWKSYLAATGWSQNLEDLLRVGLLHSHFVAKSDSKEMLGMLGVCV